MGIAGSLFHVRRAVLKRATIEEVVAIEGFVCVCVCVREIYEDKLYFKVVSVSYSCTSSQPPKRKIMNVHLSLNVVFMRALRTFLRA